MTSDPGTRCIKSFELMPKGAPYERGYFSGSLRDFQAAVGLPLHLYHACFDSDTVYRTGQEGGRYRFDSNGQNFAQVGAEDSYAFYQALWANATAATGGRGNFIGSEVDHQVNTVGALVSHRNSTDYSWRYYDGMSRAAAEAGITLQYCMSTPRHILGSIGMRAVTHARGSYDNHGSVLYNIAPLFASSLFYQAVGLKTSKDNAQTMVTDAALGIVVATLSCGPVGIGDGLADDPAGGRGTNVSLVLATCDANGTLLQPARPASGIDAMFGRGWNPERREIPPSGFISVTHTEHPSATALSSESSSSHPSLVGDASRTPGSVVSSWLVVVIAAEVEYNLTSAQLYPRPPLSSAGAATDHTDANRGSGSGGNSTFWVSRWEDSVQCAANGSDAIANGCLQQWDSSLDLDLRTPGVPHVNHSEAGTTSLFPWQLLTIYPSASDSDAGRVMGASGPGDSGSWLLLGEVGKIVRLSKNRFYSIEHGRESAWLKVCVRGARGERVLLSALPPGSTVLRTLEVVVGGHQWGSVDRDGSGIGWVQCAEFE
jgi:hypothetical protein